MRSPILKLETFIAGSTFRIAPEREVELGDWSDLTKFSIAIVDRKGFSIKVSVKKREASLPVAALEYLWAASHAYIVLYDEYCTAQKDGEEYFDTSGNSRRRNAIDLGKWAVDNMFGSATEDWPCNFPMPDDKAPHGSDIHVANELFLCAIAWIIHHEIAHVKLEHPDVESVTSLSEEREADISATSWILAHSDVEAEYRKRTVGIATAILAIQGTESNTGDILQTHPKAFERLYDCLENAQIDDDNEVYAFSSFVMQMQLATQGISIPTDANSFKELFSEILIIFARQVNS